MVRRRRIPCTPYRDLSTATNAPSAPAVSPDSRGRAPDARRAQERRDAQWPSRQLRHVDEPHPQRSHSDEPQRREVLAVTRDIRARQHCTASHLSDPNIYTSLYFMDLGEKAMRWSGVLTWRQQIKYLRVPDEIVDIVKEQQAKDQANRGGHGHGHGRGGAHRGEHRGDRGGRGGMRGRGRGRGRGGGGGGAAA